jgi:hypothetical protein
MTHTHTHTLSKSNRQRVMTMVMMRNSSSSSSSSSTALYQNDNNERPKSEGIQKKWRQSVGRGISVAGIEAGELTLTHRLLNIQLTANLNSASGDVLRRVCTRSTVHGSVPPPTGLLQPHHLPVHRRSVYHHNKSKPLCRAGVVDGRNVKWSLMRDLVVACC